jgi:plastocyanin
MTGKKLIILVLLVACVLGLWLLVFGLKDTTPKIESGRTTVVLTPDGFSPANVRIRPGTTITFTTTTGKPFWPASDLHPSHTLYPAFDPKHPIEATASWSFTFTDEGEFSFHDHLSPYATGEIIVGEREGDGILMKVLKTIRYYLFERKVSFFLDSCAPYEQDRSKRLECWQGVMRKVVAYEGVSAAFDWIRQLHEISPYFSADCHVYAHEIGESAYIAWQKGVRFRVVSEMGLCDLGFYHGFLQELVSHTGRVTDSLKFCEAAKEQTYFRDEQERESVVSQCYHGMGHGIAYDLAPRLWGEDREIVAQGIAQCEELLPPQDGVPSSYLTECVNGVFGGIVGMYFGLHGFSLTMDLNDPFRLCRGWKPAYEYHCYDSFVPPLVGRLNLDMVAAGKYIMAISDAQTAQTAMRHLGFMASLTYAVDVDKWPEVIAICRSFQQPFLGDCIYGFASSLVRIGTKEAGLARARQLCDAPYLQEEERTSCFEGLIQQYKYGHGEEALRELCAQTDGGFKERCSDIYKEGN